jgi:hypothetical protein
MDHPDTPAPPEHLDLTDPASVIAVLEAGAEANVRSPCRQGSIDVIDPPGWLIATGDLHDNPIHYAKLLTQANLSMSGDPHAQRAGKHLTLHEIIHSDRLFQGMDLSYRMLTQVALLKARYPELVHTLVGNHEIAQLINAPVIKDGVRCVEAFHAGLGYVFGSEAERVDAAARRFIRSMPLALEVRTPRGTILCAHSLPPASAMGRFDAGILRRDLTDDDYQPRVGSAYLMTWGRGYDAEGLEDLVERWGVTMFLLGHEKAEEGVKFVPPNAIVLASDHDRGTFLPINLQKPPAIEEAQRRVVWLSSV